MKRRDHTPITGKKIKPNSAVQKESSYKREKDQLRENRANQMQKNNYNFSNNDLNIGLESNKQNQKPQFYEFNRHTPSNSVKQTSKFLKNNSAYSNPAKTNATMNDSRQTDQTNENVNQSNPVSNTSMIVSQKQMGNKSVLIVKPNHFGGMIANDSGVFCQGRNSKKKMHEFNSKQNKTSINKDNVAYGRESNITDPSQTRNSKISNFFRVDSNITKVQQLDKAAKKVDSNLINPAGRVSQSLQVNKASSSLTKKSPAPSSSIITKMRSSSTRASRKQQIPLSNTSIPKNYSYTGKGKWKL